jgi:arginase
VTLGDWAGRLPAARSSDGALLFPSFPGAFGARGNEGSVHCGQPVSVYEAEQDARRRRLAKPAAGGSVNEMTPAGLALIGVPANSGGTVDGVARAPAVLRQRGLATALARHPGFTDVGDLALPVPVPVPVPVRGMSGLLAEDTLVAMIEHVAEAVAAARRRGRFPLLLGGDCPVILGALAALRAEADRPGLLIVDGHEDAWPPRTSPTGEAADCELGLALRLFDTGLSPQLRAALPRIDPADVAAVGPRDTSELAAACVASLDGPR